MILVILIRIFKPENGKQKIVDRIVTGTRWSQSAPNLFANTVSIG
jgi:hypothetical protein